MSISQHTGVFHSSETPLPKILSDITTSVDSGKTLLDLSAAFYTTGHITLHDCLND